VSRFQYTFYIYHIHMMKHAPKNGGSRSMSTFSVTTNLLLRCLRGGFPTIGMVSLGPVLRRDVKEPARGGVAPPPRPPPRSIPRAVLSGEEPKWPPRDGSLFWESGLTTTMGGVGEALLILLTILLLLLLSPEYLRSRVTAGEDGEAVRLEEEEPPREWLLELLVEILARLATEDEPGLGRGFWLLGGGGGGGIAEGVDDGFGSLFLDELFLLSCGGSQMYALRLKIGLRERDKPGFS
jgi:hypothetical protein